MNKITGTIELSYKNGGIEYNYSNNIYVNITKKGYDYDTKKFFKLIEKAIKNNKNSSYCIKINAIDFLNDKDLVNQELNYDNGIYTMSLSDYKFSQKEIDRKTFNILVKNYIDNIYEDLSKYVS